MPTRSGEEEKKRKEKKPVSVFLMTKYKNGNYNF
jgi:hypothetical protein